MLSNIAAYINKEVIRLSTSNLVSFAKEIDYLTVTLTIVSKQTLQIFPGVH